MYHPYFRGKQFDLLAIKESAEILSRSNFTPIIEPVRESLTGLKRAIEAVSCAGGNAVLIVNPYHGDYNENASAIRKFVLEELKNHTNIYIGVLLTQDLTIKNVQEICDGYSDRPIYFIHSGFSEARELAEATQDRYNTVRHVFNDKDCSIPYRRHFKDYQRILLKDGFNRQANRKYPEVELFSDLHVTFQELQYNGFGDFLIVGDDYSESGGPAYAVAIHLTFLDPDMDAVMYTQHFKSDRHDSPADLPGKFLEALNKLVAEVTNPNTKILRTDAVEEFMSLHERKHFPGLGYIKKLSMKHHIQLLSSFLGSRT